jgi:hypothetical protein
MSLALAALSVKHQLRSKRLYITATPSGLYVPGGDTVNLSLLTNPVGTQLDARVCFPGVIDDFSVLTAPAGYSAKLIRGSGLTNWGLKVFSEACSAGIPLTLGALSAASTVSAVVAHVGTITIANTLSAGNFVYLSGFTQLGALNGCIVQVASATTSQFTFNLGSAAAVTSGADTTGHFQVVYATPNNLVQLGTSATITNSLATTSLLTMTCANTFTLGQFVVLNGLINGAVANGVIVRIASASTTQFTAVWTGTAISTGAETTATATLLVTNGAAPILADYMTNVSNSLATASSAGTAGLITLTATQSMVPGQLFLVNGLTNGAAVNGDVLSVIAAGTTNAIIKANGQTAAFSTAADVGSISLLMTGDPAINPGTSGMVELPAAAYPAAVLADVFTLLFEGAKGKF